MDIAIAVAVVGLRQGGTDRVKVVVLERKGLEVPESCRPNTGDVLELKAGDLQRAAYPVVTEAGEPTLSCTVVVARRSKPRGSMAGVWCFGVAVDLWHLPITFENPVEIYSHWNGASRPRNWRWRTGTNTEVVGRNTWRTG